MGWYEGSRRSSLLALSIFTFLHGFDIRQRSSSATGWNALLKPKAGVVQLHA